MISFKLKHLHLAEGYLIQDAREVTTKFGKSFITTFFPIGNEAREIVEGWVKFLTKEMLWAPTDPLFPATFVDVGAGQVFHAAGLSRQHWTTADGL